jgi:transcriptional regulator with XRE-family HTH domain
MISENQKEILARFGTHLKALRKKKKLSLRKLATNCNVEHADIKRYEDGEINPTLLTISELAKGLEIPLKELMDF